MRTEDVGLLAGPESEALRTFSLIKLVKLLAILCFQRKREKLLFLGRVL